MRESETRTVRDSGAGGDVELGSVIKRAVALGSHGLDALCHVRLTSLSTLDMVSRLQHV